MELEVFSIGLILKNKKQKKNQMVTKRSLNDLLNTQKKKKKTILCKRYLLIQKQNDKCVKDLSNTKLKV